MPGKFLEPVLVELIPGGSNIPVSASRVQEYVRYIMCNNIVSLFSLIACVFFKYFLKVVLHLYDGGMYPG